MSDFLLIRFPGKPIQRFSGKFKQVPAAQNQEGFIFTDFLHQKVFAFEVANEFPDTTAFHFSQEEPVVISPRDYLIESQAMLNGFSVMNVEKAVYSRVKRHSFDSKNAVEAFEKACELYPTASCYLVSSELFGTWLGASPELLVSTENDRWSTMALAGTRKVESAEYWEQKEREEHDYVIRAIVAALERANASEIEVSETIEKIAGPVKHLYTPIQASGTSEKAWQFAIDLHPTPAVCGTPRIASLDLLLSREMHERELYAGMFGWVSKEHTELYVNLRCAQLTENAAFLYVGGGYTIDSIPQKEWEETEHKASTLLKVLQ